MSEPKPPVSPKGNELPPELDQAIDRHAKEMDARMNEALHQLDETLSARVPESRPEAASPASQGEEKAAVSAEAAIDDQQLNVRRRQKRRPEPQTQAPSGSAQPGEIPSSQATTAFPSDTAPKAPEVSKLPMESSTPKEEKKTEPEWTLDRLLGEVSNERRFILTSPEGGEKARTHRYKRQGNDFLNKKGNTVNDQVLDRLNAGWKMTLEPEEEKKVPEVPEAAPENAEQHEFHPGDTWEKKTDEGREYLTIKDVHGKNLTVRTYFQRNDRSGVGQGGYGISAENLQKELRNGGYVFVPGMTAKDLLKKNEKPEAPEENVGEYEFRVLKNGEEQKYLAGDDTLFIVQKKKDGYYFVNDDESLTGPMTQDVMRHQAEAEGWRMIEQDPMVPEEQEVAPVAEAAPVTPEILAAPEEPKEVPKVETLADTLQQKIDALKTEVAEFRYKYAEMDYEKTSAWKTLKGFFRNMTSNGEEDADTRYWASEYQSKLMELKNLELEQIKQEGLKGEELRERMAGVIQYYKYEQAAALYNDRTQVRMDRQGFIGKIWGAWEQGVKAYGKLPLFKKVMVGAALVGLSMATGGVGAAGVLVLRRMISATGVAMATDAALAAFLDKKEQEKQAKDLKKEMDQLMDSAFVSSPEERLSGLLNEAIGDLNQKLQKKKLVALVRKAAAANVGLLGSIALSSAASHMIAGHEGVTGGHAPAASAPEAASSAPAASVPEHTPAPSTEGVIPEATPQEHVVSFDRYEVTTEDGKRGLWGILEQHLPEDMLPQTEKSRIIQSLENAIQLKLDHMSPAELKAVGFPTGNVNNIYAGTQIDLGKLLTPDEVQSVMEGKNIVLPHTEIAAPVVESSAPNHVPEVAQPSSPQPELRQPKPIFDTNPLHNGSAGIAAAAPDSALHEQVSFTDPKAYLREHPEALERYSGTLGRLRMGIFMLPPTDGGVPMEYDYTLNGEKLGNTKIENVLRDLKRFDGALSGAQPEYNPITNPIQHAIAEQVQEARGGSSQGFWDSLQYDRIKNPLHYDQMTALSKFLEASEKAFGKEMAKVEDGESIDHYTRRMATAALRMGKEIKGFYKP
jgi:hypothetical protein